MSLPEQPPQTPPPTPEQHRRRMLIRIVIWVVVGGIGLYLTISGIVGILAKG